MKWSPNPFVLFEAKKINLKADKPQIAQPIGDNAAATSSEAVMNFILVTYLMVALCFVLYHGKYITNITQ
ncbi:hypothetical protein DPMN_055410 [Dreissena polymorpha]|uniref:Uncharacterized protein n=1 Tax=Dreissena polymorpha TaxID=45954 RepID=A0A9D4CPY2_DREPO|nr:hypothetical protein DPMN_055410 [Dreissena polymorpha]